MIHTKELDHRIFIEELTVKNGRIQYQFQIIDKNEDQNQYLLSLKNTYSFIKKLFHGTYCSDDDDLLTETDFIAGIEDLTKNSAESLEYRTYEVTIYCSYFGFKLIK